jgi:beta-galactosidase
MIGTGNGDNTSHEPEKTNQRSLFNGVAQFIVQSQRDSSGTVVLTAEADGLKPAEARIIVDKAAAIPGVPPTDLIFTLAHWRMSPIAATKPDPNVEIGDTDMNTWSNFQPGSAQKFDGGAWEIYRTAFTPVAGVQQNGGQILFKEITGSAEVWVDGQLLGEKKDAIPAGFHVKLPSAAGARTVTVLVNSGGADKAGLSGSVIVAP